MQHTIRPDSLTGAVWKQTKGPHSTEIICSDRAVARIGVNGWAGPPQQVATNSPHVTDGLI